MPALAHRPLRCASVWRCAAVVLGLVTSAAQGAARTPYVPATDAALVQRLTQGLALLGATGAAKPMAPSAGAGLPLHTALLQQPNNLGLALATAKDAVQRARDTGDPRALGQAQAALAPWWSRADAPDAVRLLQATILQSQHHFSAALKLLDALIANPAPDTPPPLLQQARLTRATVHQVQGRLDEAALDCQALSTTTLGAVCNAELRSLRGEPSRAARELAQLRHQGAAHHQGWLALLQAELALRLGDSASAAQHFETALAQASSVYVRVAQADALLDQGHNQQALAALAPFEATGDEPDAVLLRRAIALKRSQHASAPAAAAALQQRFLDARTSAQALHLREEARFALDVQDQPARAWALAQTNWQSQREPADALLYVRAAVAAGALEQAQQLSQQLKARGWHDVRLDRSLARPGPQRSTTPKP
jgi:hypothetical protein